MFGGFCFMVDGKMCIGVVKDEMMCRIDPELNEFVLEKTGYRSMDFTGKPMRGVCIYEQRWNENKKKLLNIGLAYVLSLIQRQKQVKRSRRRAETSFAFLLLSVHPRPYSTDFQLREFISVLSAWKSSIRFDNPNP